jgi:hypothetical protein
MINTSGKTPTQYWVLLFFMFLQTGEAAISDVFDLQADFRSYFFQRDFKGETRDRESLAFGGILRADFHPYSSLKTVVSLYTSQGAGLNDETKDVYNLLAKDDNGRHKNYTALGEAYIETGTDSLRLRLGRQEMTTPWVNLHDVRMTPQSFDALVLAWRLTGSDDLYLCHAIRMKDKTGTSAKPMSETAGFGGDEPVSCLGLEGQRSVDYKFWTYRAHKMWDDLYLRLDYQPDESSWYMNVRYLKRITADDSLAGKQDTWHAGIAGGLTIGKLDLYAAHSRNGNRNILRKWGHDTTISNQVEVADRARESAWLLGMSYRPQTAPGFQFSLSGSIQDTPDSGSHQSPDRNEYNLDLQYRLIPWSPGTSLRARYAWVRETGLGAENHNDLRLHLRYTVELI